MPDSPVFLTARWIHLAMLNFEVDPGLLLGRVPAGTELDSFDGRTYVSMVGFQFLDTRVMGLSIPFHRNFDEVNLRFYVRRELPGEIRRGVVFIKEIVPRLAIAWVARWLYNENYVALPMSHRDELGSRPHPRLAYDWIYRGRRNRISVQVAGAPTLRPTDSLESFITEHYWGYCGQPDGTTMEYQVEHPRWPLWQAEEVEFECDAAGLYGKGFAACLATRPSSAFLAQGSQVLVRRGRLLER